MGIQGLLKMAAPASRSAQLSEFRGQKVGVDISCWLHRAAFGCARQLALGEPTEMYTRWIIKHAGMLRSEGIEAVFVFDGQNLPAKADTNRSRGDERGEAKREGLRLYNSGETMKAEALFQKAVRITDEMVAVTINNLRAVGWKCIVAPYEADSQLAYLYKYVRLLPLLLLCCCCCCCCCCCSCCSCSCCCCSCLLLLSRLLI